MNVSKKSEAHINEDLKASLYLIQAINAYRKKHGFTQKALTKRLSLNQGTISKMLSEKSVTLSSSRRPLSFQEACRFCEAMDSTIGAVLYEYDQQIAQNSTHYDNKDPKEYLAHRQTGNIPEHWGNIPNPTLSVFPSYLFSEGDNLTNNIYDPMFIPWFGTYHCYFHSTLSSEDVCFHGHLEIPQTSVNGCCHVTFDFTYDKNKKLHKKYYGNLILSKKTNGAYCTLVNHDDQGEITYLVMTNPAVKNSRVCCVLAFAVTISGGKDTNHPCVERMIISREELSGKSFEIAKAHLLLNDKYIRITEDSFRALLEVDGLPESFKQRFINLDHPFDAPLLAEYLPRIAVIPETWVKSLPGHTEKEQQRIIDFMRLYSLAPKYNKIKQKTAENDIFEMFKDAFENGCYLSDEEVQNS